MKRCSYMVGYAGADEPSGWCDLFEGHDGEHHVDYEYDDPERPKWPLPSWPRDEVEPVLCAWCDLPLLGSYLDRNGACWHLDCYDDAIPLAAGLSVEGKPQ